jgi:Domain of unknown function (DUF1929).
MGQRYVQLESSYTGFDNNTAVLHVRPLPPNPSILVPGPAFLFVVVKGVPSIGVPVMVGSGQLGKQDALPTGDLPSSSIVRSSEAPADAPPKNAGSRISWDVDWFALASSLLFLSLHLEWWDFTLPRTYFERTGCYLALCLTCDIVDHSTFLCYDNFYHELGLLYYSSLLPIILRNIFGLYPFCSHHNGAHTYQSLNNLVVRSSSRKSTIELLFRIDF